MILINSTNSNIMFSIKPKYMSMILSGQKIYEYRNRYWKTSYPSWFTIYESSPISEVKYLMLLDEPRTQEDVPLKQSYGTESFNDGTSTRKYAYPILNVIKVSHPINLRTLKNINVTPPQDYMYINRKIRFSTLIEPIFIKYGEKIS